MRRLRRTFAQAPALRPSATRVPMGSVRNLGVGNNQSSSENQPGVNDLTINTDAHQETIGFSTVSGSLNSDAASSAISDEAIEDTPNTVGQFEYGSLDDAKYGRILRAIREVISCCACYSSYTIMKECTNGHLICQNCFLTLRQDERPQCPTCRANLYSDSRRALIAQKVLSELPDMCVDCNTQMLHKSLPSHRLNSCPKRRVACGLSSLGCEWIGFADQYDIHFHQCLLRKQLSEHPIGNNLDWLINKFKKREQTMRETFHCFSNVLRHLESHELQSVTITLANVSNNENVLQYRSDHFHVNQSRWTAEITMRFPVAHVPTETVAAPGDVTQLTVEDIRSTSTDSSVGIDQIDTVTLPFSGSSGRSQSPVMRRRRWHNASALRHHPYQITIGVSQLPHNTLINPQVCDLSSVQDLNATRNVDQVVCNDHSHLGEITYRMLKENSPGIGRRSYAFSLLQIRVPDTGIQIYARPQIQTFRFTSRGDQSSVFSVHPIRWRYISSLKELSKYRLIQAELLVARRIAEEHMES
ncbi:unnamed protein product [Dicrocoelium dendriticum]|nr:unnamed protein product [Dicrocoelium dendriticum]